MGAQATATLTQPAKLGPVNRESTRIFYWVDRPYFVYASKDVLKGKRDAPTERSPGILGAARAVQPFVNSPSLPALMDTVQTSTLGPCDVSKHTG